MDLFATLNINDASIQNPLVFWESDSKYIDGQVRLHYLAVVNDSAEQGIALIKKFNPTLTTKEEDKQFLLKAVFKHREEYPEKQKAELIK